MVAGSTSETEIIESHRFSFWCMGRGLPRFDGPVLISDMRILGPPLTPHPMAAFGAQSRHAARLGECPLLKAKRTPNICGLMVVF
jgi:hypothetical protein